MNNPIKPASIKFSIEALDSNGLRVGVFKGSTVIRGNEKKLQFDCFDMPEDIGGFEVLLSLSLIAEGLAQTSKEALIKKYEKELKNFSNKMLMKLILSEELKKNK